MDLRIVVQHRQRLFRDGLSELLAAENGFEVVGTVNAPGDVLSLCERDKPDIVLMEADVPGTDVVSSAARLLGAVAGLRIVGMTVGQLTRSEVVRIRRGGLKAVVCRARGAEAVLEAVRGNSSQARSGAVTTLRASGRLVDQQPPLTPREITVLSLVGAGLTSREISGRLTISYKTVENHKQRIFAKLGVKNQAHAVSVAMRTGVIRPERVIELAVAD